MNNPVHQLLLPSVSAPDPDVRQRHGRRRAVLALCGLLAVGCALPLGTAGAAQPVAAQDAAASTELAQAEQTPGLSRGHVLIGSITIFVLAIFVGFEVITKVPPTLHTPLMSGSNAISGITVVGALLAAGAQRMDLAAVLGTVAVVMASINVVGGFLLTHRMLSMFRRKN